MNSGWVQFDIPLFFPFHPHDIRSLEVHNKDEKGWSLTVVFFIRCRFFLTKTSFAHEDEIKKMQPFFLHHLSCCCCCWMFWDGLNRTFKECVSWPRYNFCLEIQWWGWRRKKIIFYHNFNFFLQSYEMQWRKKIEIFHRTNDLWDSRPEIVFIFNGKKECLLSVYENDVEALFYGSIGGFPANVTVKRENIFSLHVQRCCLAFAMILCNVKTFANVLMWINIFISLMPSESDRLIYFSRIKI